MNWFVARSGTGWVTDTIYPGHFPFGTAEFERDEGKMMDHFENLNEDRILFIDSCVRDCSRTRLLSEYLISRLEGSVSRVCLEETAFPHMDQGFLQMRDRAAAADDHSADVFALARQFAQADIIVIAAPFWDLSFPASLKTYIEQINVLGVTFGYTPEGEPYGLCRARRLYYVTTAGGPIYSAEYGYRYIKAQCDYFYGIPETVLISAEGLDLLGADPERILEETKKEIDSILLREKENTSDRCN